MMSPPQESFFEGAFLPGPRPARPREDATVPWLLLDLNSYFASCEQQADPSLRGRPLGIVPVLAETTSCVAISVEAKARGVKMGMRLPEVRRICPDIVFRQGRNSYYVETHHRIREAIERCLPVHSTLSIDEFSCELRGSQRLLPNAIALAKEVKREILSSVGICLRSSVGLAPNPFLAKIASDLRKPDGLTLFLKENLPHALHGLPLRALPGVGPKMEKHLLAAGVRDVTALLSCSREELRRIWGGVVGERFFEWLRGEMPPLPPTRTRSLGHEHVLSPDLRRLDAAWKIAQNLLDRAARRLRSEKYFARRLSLHVRAGSWNEPEHHEESARLPEETQDTVLLLRTLRAFWSKLPSETKPVKIGVTLSELIPESEHQYSLFGNPRREELSRALDSIHARYGKGAVTFASLHELEEKPKQGIAFSRVPKLEEF